MRHLKGRHTRRSSVRLDDNKVSSFRRCPQKDSAEALIMTAFETPVHLATTTTGAEPRAKVSDADFLGETRW